MTSTFSEMEKGHGLFNITSLSTAIDSCLPKAVARPVLFAPPCPLTTPANPIPPRRRH